MPFFQVVEWKRRLEKFEKQVQALDVLLMRLFVGPNKSVLCDIYAYLWDMKGVLGTCLAYVRWLGKSRDTFVVVVLSQRELMKYCCRSYLLGAPWQVNQHHLFRPHACFIISM